jgi:cytosine/adenosine deaminase-related metal-dependent hydrolase
MKDPSMIPCHDPASNVVYSLNGNAVKYNIVDGRLIMDNGSIKGEDEIIERAVELSRELRSG